MTVERKKERKKERNPALDITRVIAVLSNLTFGVYIVHPLIQTMVGWVIKYTHNPFAYIICSYSVIVVVSFVGCFIASKTPIIKKSIRM